MSKLFYIVPIIAMLITISSVMVLNEKNAKTQLINNKRVLVVDSLKKNNLKK
jgi:hypothetical protein